MTRQVALVVFGIVAVGLVPTAFAWHAWYRTDRFHLARWRNVIGLVSLVTTTLVWSGAAVATVLQQKYPRFSEGWALAIMPLSILALPCGLALKGLSRFLALASSAITQIVFVTAFQINI